MSTVKRKVYRVLKWSAIIAGIAGAIITGLIGLNAFRVHFSPLPGYFNSDTSNPSNISYVYGTPMFLSYDGYFYDFNIWMNVQLMFPNGTIIDSDSDYAVWPLGLYMNTFKVLNISLNYSQSVIDWCKANNQPIFVFTIVRVWFNLPIFGNNYLITPVTIYDIYPVYPH